MKHSILIFFVAIFLILPFTALAEIRLNEIAWMGGNGNSNCEWIELYNTDDIEVDISGWSFVIGSSTNPILEASYPGDLVIEPNGYYVVARKFGSTAASATVCHPYFQAFTASHLGGIGSLNNTSLTITLFDEIGTIIDSVTNSTLNWSDYSKANTGNYDTVQRHSNSWTLSAPTPAEPNTASIEQDTPKTTSEAKPVRVVTWDNDQIRSLSIVAPDTLHVGIPFTFRSVTSPKDSRKFKSHLWNFGDFTTSTLSSPTHTYQNPGTYEISLTIENKDAPYTLTKTVTVIEPTITATRLSNGNLELTNNGSTAIDLSFFQVVGNVTFVIPEHSTILANAKLIIPAQTIVNAKGLFNPQGELVTHVVTEAPNITNLEASTRAATYEAAPITKTAVPPPTKADLKEESEATATSSATPTKEESLDTKSNSTTTTPFPAYRTLGILLVIAVGASLIKLRLQ